ncbi:MAG: tannase/feruloyl esterase family alpha/beta hydrolase, partial [Ferrovibrionaceae bacterium]
YFGWADPALMPRMGVDYYEKAVAANGPGTRDFFRLFMVPGMFHCRGGNGTDRFDAMTAVLNWVGDGRAPDRIEAARVIVGGSVRSRPLCPYPQVARHDGRGPADKAGSIACRDPRRPRRGESARLSTPVDAAVATVAPGPGGPPLTFFPKPLK